MANHTNTSVLWGGPHDGREVATPIGARVITQPYETGTPGNRVSLDARYVWNPSPASGRPARFEWDCYENLPPAGAQ